MPKWEKHNLSNDGHWAYVVSKQSQSFSGVIPMQKVRVARTAQRGGLGLSDLMFCPLRSLALPGGVS